MYGKVATLLVLVSILFGCAAYRVEIKQLPPGARRFFAIRSGHSYSSHSKVH